MSCVKPARHIVIDYPTATLLRTYCWRHRLWLNDNDPGTQLKSVYGGRTQQTAMTAKVSLGPSTWWHATDILTLFVVFFASGSLHVAHPAMSPKDAAYLGWQRMTLYFIQAELYVLVWWSPRMPRRLMGADHFYSNIYFLSSLIDCHPAGKTLRNTTKPAHPSQSADQKVGLCV